MTNYELFNSQGYKYMIYLAEQIIKLENDIKKYFSKDRDMKLRLLIDEDLPKLKEHIEENLNQIITSFNQLEIDKMNVIDFEKRDTIKELESIADNLNSLIKYFDYVTNRVNELHKEKLFNSPGWKSEEI